LAQDFGRRIDAVKIEGNVICGADEKVIYLADWSLLGAPDRAADADAIDIADLVDEKLHGYVLPAPLGGYAIGAILRDARGARRFDGGRIIPEGRAESFRIASHVRRGPATLSLRTDDGGPVGLRVEQERDGLSIEAHDVDIPQRSGGVWSEIAVPLED